MVNIMLADLNKLESKDYSSAFRLVKYMLSCKDGQEYTSDIKERVLKCGSYLMMPIPYELSDDSIKHYANYAKKQFQSYSQLPKNEPKHFLLHEKLNFNPDDTDMLLERLDKNDDALFDLLTQINEEFVKEVYGENRAYIYALHGDTNHLHFHNAISTVCRETNKIYSRTNEYLFRMEVCEKLEKKYGLKLTPNRELVHDKDRYKTSKAEKRMNDKGVLSAKQKMQNKFKEIEKKNFETFKDFVEFLITELNIFPIVKLKSGSYSEIQGISFEDYNTGERFKGAEISKKWTFNRIQSKYKYSEKKDLHFLKRFLKVDTSAIIVSTDNKPTYLFKDTAKFQPRTSLKTKFEILSDNRIYELYRGLDIEDDAQVYVFKSSQNLAFKHNSESSITTMYNNSNLSIKAALQLYNENRNKQNKEVYEVKTKSSSNHFRKKMWIQNELLKYTNTNHNVIFTGYNPTQKDLEYLRELKMEHEVLFKNEKNKIKLKV